MRALNRNRKTFHVIIVSMLLGHPSIYTWSYIENVRHMSTQNQLIYLMQNHQKNLITYRKEA